MKAIFIGGTDTGVGKTVVTGLLAGYLARRGWRVATQKWVGTGSDNDIASHRSFLDAPAPGRERFGAAMAPYRFRYAASPHLAARLEGRRVDPRRIGRSLRTLAGHFDFVLVEGAGGLLVPLGRKVLAIDIVRRFGLPVLLVSANRLGAINHTLLSLEALRARRIPVVGVIFNSVLREKRLIARDNPAAVKEFSGLGIIGVLPHVRDPRGLKKIFEPIGERIVRAYG